MRRRWPGEAVAGKWCGVSRSKAVWQRRASGDKTKNEAHSIWGREKRKHPFPNPPIFVGIGGSYLSAQRPLYICGQTDEYSWPVKVKWDDPYIHQFPYPTDEYYFICVGFKTDEYNLNIFIGTDGYKKTDE
jgi:hypothetical protein